MNGARRPFTLDITCSNCGQTGTVTWNESVAMDRPHGPDRRLADLSEGFHTETGRTQSGDALIVCDSCDEIQAD